MNFFRRKASSITDPVTVVDHVEGLSALTNPGCAAAIWRRQPPADFQSWIDQLAPETLPRGRVILRPEAIGQTLAELCAIAGTPEGPGRRWLEQDIMALAKTFSGMTDAQYLRLRLDVVTTNACRKFHIDAIRARLICSYRGSGTQYGLSVDGAEPTTIQSVETGSPMLMRGTLWPTNPPAGLLHRSPPIEGTGETRFVLVLDPVFDPEDA